MSTPNPYFYNLDTPPQIYDFPEQSMDDLISRYGVEMFWQKSHTCPCVYQHVNPSGMNYPITGSPLPNCQTCGGRGYFWDAAQGPFGVLLTFMYANVIPGASVQKEEGFRISGKPILTIPGAIQPLYSEASAMDAFVETGSAVRFNSVLRVGGRTTLPYNVNVTVNVDNVLVYNSLTQTSSPIPSSAVTVDGASVTLTGYATGTSYVVEYTAYPIYIAYQEHGGMPQVRPFIQNQVNYPRRFELQLLDVWERTQAGGLGGALP
jgi:hypothetical protein